MVRANVKLFIIVVLVFNYSQAQLYSVPDPKIEVFTPKGIRVSIQDTPGMQLFSFHGKINSAFGATGSSQEPGQIDVDTLKPMSGLWIVEDDNVQLEVGDTIYYWIFVQYQNVGFRKENGRWEVKELLNKDGSIAVGSPADGQAPDNGTPICELTATRVNGQSSCRGKLIFTEDFSQEKLDDKKWTLESFIPQHPDYEFNSFQRKPANSFIADGNFNVLPTLETDEDYITSGTLNLSISCTGNAGDDECIKSARTYLILPPVTSARISSLPYFSFLYGKVEIRAKLPAGDWIFPELFLLPKDHAYGTGYESGRIWIAFSRGNTQLVTYDGNDLSSKVLSGGFVLAQNDPLKSVGIKSKISRDRAWHDSFHTYTLIWTPEGITLAVDSETYGVLSIPDGGFGSLGQQFGVKYTQKWRSPGAPFDKEFYLVLGVGVGGVSDFPDTGQKPWQNKNPKALFKFWQNRNKWYPTWNAQSSRMQIDYVRIWAL